MIITLFKSKDILKTRNHVRAGGIALHIWRGDWHKPKPGCFVNGELWEHLFDQNEERLIATARRLGVQRIHVSNKGKLSQHIDLCKGPLGKAIRKGVWYEE